MSKPPYAGVAHAYPKPSQSEHALDQPQLVVVAGVAVAAPTARNPDLHRFQALIRTRTGEPLLTMEELYQLS